MHRSTNEIFTQVFLFPMCAYIISADYSMSRYLRGRCWGAGLIPPAASLPVSPPSLQGRCGASGRWSRPPGATAGPARLRWSSGSPARSGPATAGSTAPGPSAAWRFVRGGTPPKLTHPVPSGAFTHMQNK